MTNFLKAAGQAQRGLSPALWGSMPERLIAHPGSGIFIFDDFENLPVMASANTGKYACYLDSGVTLKGIPTVSVANGQFGVAEVANNTTANFEASIQTGGNIGAALKIASAGAEARVVAFEARVKKASIANNGSGFFVGLGEEGLAAADTLVDTTLEVASKDLVGFHVLAASGASVDFIYRKAGQAKQTVRSAAGTMVADTWMKMGFIFNPKAPTTKRIRAFIDGVEIPYWVTSTNIAAATFPDDEELALLWATKNVPAAESKLQIDWWAAGMLAY